MRVIPVALAIVAVIFLSVIASKMAAPPPVASAVNVNPNHAATATQPARGDIGYPVADINQIFNGMK